MIFIIPWYLYLPLSKATFFTPFSIDLFAISLPTLSANSFLVNFSVMKFFSIEDAGSNREPYLGKFVIIR